MARLPVLTRSDAPEQFLEAFDEETSASGGIVDSGPGSVMIYSPKCGAEPITSSATSGR